MEFTVVPRKAGEPCLAPHLFHRAWDECIESQGMDKEAWVSRTLSIIESVPRYEIGMVVQGGVVGGVTLTLDDDPHVGECLCVMSQYVLPEYRNQGISGKCMRECIRLTKELGHSMLAFTHRQRDWVYTTTYRKIK